VWGGSGFERPWRRIEGSKILPGESRRFWQRNKKFKVNNKDLTPDGEVRETKDVARFGWAIY
jgi:hypothetical protein